MAQAPQPMFINIPPPSANQEPSDLPDTPTSTTTSLSTLSTTAIKDGQRGHLPPGPSGRGHQHHPSTTSLEAERADRISRLAGLERVSTLRAPPQRHESTTSSISPQTTPTSTAGAFPPNFPASHNLTPSYFDGNGQPMAVTKMSTVGSASASSRDARQTVTDGDGDEDMRSDTNTNYREPPESVTSTGGVDEESSATRSVGGFDDRMSDDGSASLVGFGEGANSTVSGPIYQRRPAPSSQGVPWLAERTASGLSDLRREQEDNPEYLETPTLRATRQTAEKIMQDLDGGEATVGKALGSPGQGGEPLGKFYFEPEQ